MNELLARIIDAHGGMERWNGHEKVNATIVSGGGLFPLKGVPQDLEFAGARRAVERGDALCETVRTLFADKLRVPVRFE